MPTNNKKRFLVLVAIVLIVAIIPPVLFGTPKEIADQKGGDPWRNIIFDFQTLLTGLLAVGAASWTVMTMERTDKEAERRHRELVTLTLRADRLRIDRLLTPHFDLFEAWNHRIANLNIQSLPKQEKEISSDCRAVADKFAEEIRNVRTLVFDSPGWKDAEPLFNGELNHKVYLLKLYLEVGARKATACREAVDKDREWIIGNDGVSVADRDRLGQLEAWRELIRISKRLRETSKIIVQELRTLARTYDLDHHLPPLTPSPDQS